MRVYSAKQALRHVSPMGSHTLTAFSRLLPSEQRAYARHEGTYLGCAIYPDSESHFYQVGDIYVAFTLTRTRRKVTTAFQQGPEFARMLRGIRLRLARFGIESGSR